MCVFTGDSSEPGRSACEPLADSTGSRQTHVSYTRNTQTVEASPVPIPYSLVWGLFLVFTVLHLLANHRAVSVVCMETLNKNRSPHSQSSQQNMYIYTCSVCRLHIVMADYLSTGSVPAPASVNAREPILMCAWWRGQSPLSHPHCMSPLTAVSTRVLSYTLGSHISTVVSRYSITACFALTQGHFDGHSLAEYRVAVQRYRNGHKYVLRYQPSRRSGM